MGLIRSHSFATSYQNHVKCVARINRRDRFIVRWQRLSIWYDTKHCLCELEILIAIYDELCCVSVGSLSYDSAWRSYDGVAPDDIQAAQTIPS